ncbi:rab-like protein 6 [Conger conger]|uniref:rab-like protein 6 n=1 Tax=Conger conger TaxID=82655 RepID=UPI002A5AD965|nr:rab-like protein 6 [Conger conger]XP_061118762.1 rab-like protein 6 [Conger conger]
MFSALKKLVGSEPGLLRDKNIPAGLQSMNQSLQRRFAKGVQYNMKIVIRGDRNTGKSALWHRLQGKRFLEEYVPTQEIQVTSIHWNYKTTDDVVKVEVWDVVDKGRGKKRGGSLKLENEPQETEEPEMALDAEFLDVYKNCNGVIMVFDITKQWTFDYILRELAKVPAHMPVCVLGNQRDQGEHRVILPDDIRDFISGLNRPMGSSYIHYAESSMKNGFGLKYLHRFFNIPFLQLQRETLLQQIETNQLDINATLEELTVQHETEDQNYDIFLEKAEARRKSYSFPGPPNGQSPSSGSQSPIVPPGGASSPSAPQPPLFPAAPAGPPVVQAPPQHPEHCPPPAPTPPTAQASASAAQPQKRGLMSRFFGATSTPETPTEASGSLAPQGPQRVQTVDDFVPDLALDQNFLNHGPGSVAKAKGRAQAAAAVDTDSDGESRGGNPMVMGFQDDLDPDDEAPPKPLPSAAAPSAGVTLSSDEDDARPAPPRSPDLHNAPHSQRARVQTGPRPAGRGPAATPRGRDSGSVHAQKKGGAVTPRPETSSDSDSEAPPPAQMLSFVMDDPEIQGSNQPKGPKVTFPVRDALPDLSDEDPPPIWAPAPLRPSAVSSSSRDHFDLFGLGLQDSTAKDRDSSGEQEDKESKHSAKEKKKKKKSKTEEDGKKRHKHRKKDGDDAGSGDEKEKKKEKRKSRTKKAREVDELEAFLA